MLVTRIASVSRATPSTRIIKLDLAGQPFHHRAGQLAEIGPAGGQALVPYSIAGAPGDTIRDGRLEFLVKVDAQGRWGEDFAPPRRGQLIRVRGPIGRFTFPADPAETHFLFIAGGTGIAPLRAMIRHARAHIPGALRLLYSARTADDFAYRSELRGMARRKEIELVLTATRDVHERWRWGRGRITSSQLQGLIDDPETLCFVCGPASMVDDVPRMLEDLGIERSRIRVEEW